MPTQIDVPRFLSDWCAGLEVYCLGQVQTKIEWSELLPDVFFIRYKLGHELEIPWYKSLRFAIYRTLSGWAMEDGGELLGRLTEASLVDVLDRRKSRKPYSLYHEGHKGADVFGTLMADQAKAREAIKREGKT